MVAIAPQVIQPYNTFMDIVVDTSAVMAVLANEPERDAILRLTIGTTPYAPMSLHWEVGNAFSSILKRRRMDLERVNRAIQSYAQMDIRLVDVDLTQAVALAYRFDIYAYDAYVLVCALNMRLPLLTLDKRMIAVASLAGIPLMEVPN